jgi:hypothetical protein
VNSVFVFIGIGYVYFGISTGSTYGVETLLAKIAPAVFA